MLESDATVGVHFPVHTFSKAQTREGPDICHKEPPTRKSLREKKMHPYWGVTLHFDTQADELALLDSCIFDSLHTVHAIAATNLFEIRETVGANDSQ